MVEYLDLLRNDLIANGISEPFVALGLMAGALAAFAVQMYYYLGVYGGLPRFRNNRGIRADVPSPPVSVVVVVRENTWYFIEQGLPLLLAQQYDDFEVVVVDCSYSEEIGEMLRDRSTAEPRLHVTCIKPQPHYEHSIKLALTVGIKACRHEHIVFTTPDSYPVSDKWLSLMAKGFICGDIVIGYCGIEPRRGLLNRLMRCSRLIRSVRYLSAATRGHAYRGIAHNLGYTKSVYFGNKGFNHLNMNIGEDDLFIRKIARGDNVSVVMNPNATVRQMQYGGAGWWWALRKYLGYTFRYYPGRVRRSVRTELASRLLFFACSAAVVALTPPVWWAVPLFFVVLRSTVVTLKIRRIGRRLGERGIAWAYVLHDLWSPVGEMLLAASRRLRPSKNVWR